MLARSVLPWFGGLKRGTTTLGILSGRFADETCESCCRGKKVFSNLGPGGVRPQG
jgi:hypothetical protein